MDGFIETFDPDGSLNLASKIGSAASLIYDVAFENGIFKIQIGKERLDSS